MFATTSKYSPKTIMSFNIWLLLDIVFVVMRWVPRREIETVKLKEEVRKEIEREQMEKARGQHKGKRGGNI